MEQNAFDKYLEKNKRKAAVYVLTENGPMVETNGQLEPVQLPNEVKKEEE